MQINNNSQLTRESEWQSSNTASPSIILDTYKYNRWATDVLQYDLALQTPQASQALTNYKATINIGIHGGNEVTEILRAYVYLTILANSCASKTRLMVTKATKSIATWKLRKGMPIGLKLEITNIGDILKVMNSLQKSVQWEQHGSKLTMAEQLAAIANKTTTATAMTLGFPDIFVFTFLHPYDFLRVMTKDIARESAMGFNITISASA